MLRGFGRYTSYSDTNGQRRFAARANSFSAMPPMSGFGGGGSGGSRISGYSATMAMAPIPMLEGIIDTNDKPLLHRIYRDIYSNQPVAGMAVDLMASLAFGDNFSLTGIRDKRILESYVASIANIRTKTILPFLATEYLVIGTFIASLNWDSNKKLFNGISPHHVDHVKFEMVPMFGVAPLITLNFPPELLRAISSKDERMRKKLSNLPENMRQAIINRSMPLDPDTTIYLMRGTLPTESYGTSYYRRILPLYILEKALMRGTIDQSYRRQRAITVATVGDDNWEPNEDEISEVGNLIAQADADPVSAIIAVRNGVALSDFKRGDDFWKISDASDYISASILQALGISQGLISGDSNIATADTALSMFVESVRNFRDRITRELFYDKIFPTIAIANDFKRPRHMETGRELGNDEQRVIWNHFGTQILQQGKDNFTAICADDMHNMLSEIDDITKYWMPVVHWHRSLRPEMDSNYLSYLQELITLGLPLSMATIAGAGGMSLEEIMRGLDEDLKVRQRIAEYQKQIAALTPAPSGAEGQPANARAIEQAAKLLAGVGSVIPKRFNRNFEGSSLNGPMVRNNHGKYQTLSRKGQAVADESLARMLATTLARLARRENAEILKERARLAAD
jgi:hypothetical protein